MVVVWFPLEAGVLTSTVVRQESRSLVVVGLQSKTLVFSGLMEMDLTVAVESTSESSSVKM
jgi:hypothetical protein